MYFKILLADKLVNIEDVIENYQKLRNEFEKLNKKFPKILFPIIICFTKTKLYDILDLLILQKNEEDKYGFNRFL